MTPQELPGTWNVVELAALRAPIEYSLVGGPFGSDLTTADYQDEPGVPVIRGTNLGRDTGRFVDEGFVFVSEAKAKLLERNMAFPGDIVFTQRGTLGQVALIPAESRYPRYVVSQSQMKLTPDPTKIDRRFLFHYFRSPMALERITARTLATGVPHINLGILRSFPVSYPPLTEQRRIADLLDRSESLRVQRREALSKLDVLIRALFVDLFGEPIANPYGFPVKPLGELAAKFSDGPFGSNLKSSHYTDTGVRVVRLQNIGVGSFVDDDRAFISQGHFAELKKHECRPGDVLVGTLGDPNLRACIQPNWLSVALNKADCVQIRADERIANAAYICALLNQPSTERMAQDLILGQTRLRISMGRLRGLLVPVPPLELQHAFAHRIAAVERVKAVQRASLTEMDALFDSLQYRAFRGELT